MEHGGRAAAPGPTWQPGYPADRAPARGLVYLAGSRAGLCHGQPVWLCTGRNIWPFSVTRARPDAVRGSFADRAAAGHRTDDRHLVRSAELPGLAVRVDYLGLPDFFSGDDQHPAW